MALNYKASHDCEYNIADKLNEWAYWPTAPHAAETNNVSP